MDYSGVAIMVLDYRIEVIHGNLFGFSSEDAARGKFIQRCMAKYPQHSLRHVNILNHKSTAGIDDAEA